MFNFLKKYGIPALCLIFVLGANIYVRLFPAYFPQLKTQAKNIVADRIYSKIAERVNKTFPALYPNAKIKMVSDIGLRYYKQKKDKISAAEDAEYRRLKDPFQDELGQTYLMELDCWHWARYAENIVRLGHPGDRVVNGEQWDDFILAPRGAPVWKTQFLFYFSAFAYKVFSLFKVVLVNTFLFYLPVFFIGLLTIVLFLFSYRYFGIICAVISSLFVGMAPVFLPRSCAGWLDMDTLSLIFPLLIIWGYLKSVDSKNFKVKILWILLSSLLVGLFSFTWTGWWFIFPIIVLYEAHSLACAYSNKKLFFLALFLFLSAVFFVFFTGYESLRGLAKLIHDVIFLNAPLMNKVWPNVATTISELKIPSLTQIARACGGGILFLYALICIILLFILSLYKYKDGKRECAFIIFFWFICLFFANFHGMRFTIFLLIPLGVAFGALIGEAYVYIKDNKSKILAIITTGSIVIILCFNLIINGIGAAKGIFPLINDDWYNTLILLKNKTNEKAIINSWWDFGDWVKPIAKRRVIFDGQTQGSSQTYWMARVLISRNEQEALNILRMLNNGGNKAFEIIDSQLKDPFKSALLLEKVIIAKPVVTVEQGVIARNPAKRDDEAILKKNILLKFISSDKADEVIKLLFDKPVSAYFIVDYTMQGKITPISYLGNWDLLKNYIIHNIRRGKIDGAFLNALGFNKADVFNLYNQAKSIPSKQVGGWITNRSFRFYSGLLDGKINGDTVLFKNGLVYNKKEQTLHLYSNQGNDFELPKSLFIFENNKLSEFAYPNGKLNFSVLLLKNGDSYQALLLDRELVDSLFTRLYFLNGFGLKHFKPFIKKNVPWGHIDILEIIWDSTVQEAIDVKSLAVKEKNKRKSK